MTRLSSKLTYFYKKLMPRFWLGFLAVFLLIALATLIGRLASGDNEGAGEVAFIVLGALLTTGVAFLLFRVIAGQFADEIWDDGDSLVVKNRDHAITIPLEEIRTVRCWSPRRITLTVSTKSRLGHEIVFMPYFSPLAWFSHPLAGVLRERAEGARILPEDASS